MIYVADSLARPIAPAPRKLSMDLQEMLLEYSISEDPVAALMCVISISSEELYLTALHVGQAKRVYQGIKPSLRESLLGLDQGIKPGI